MDAVRLAREIPLVTDWHQASRTLFRMAESATTMGYAAFDPQSALTA